MNKKDLKYFEQRLREEMERLAETIDKLENSVLKRSPREASGDLSGYSIHMADMGTDAMEREKDLQLATVEGRLLNEVSEAFRKVQEGNFGDCESCGKPIGRKRLEVVPHARFCLSCQEKAERTP